MVEGRLDDAVAHQEAAIGLAEGAGLGRTLASARNAQAWTLYRRGRFEASREVARAVLAGLDPEDDGWNALAAHNALAAVVVARGDSDAAIAGFMAVRRPAAAHQDVVDEAVAPGDIGETRASQQDYPEAIRAVEAAIDRGGGPRAGDRPPHHAAPRGGPGPGGGDRPRRGPGPSHARRPAGPGWRSARRRRPPTARRAARVRPPRRGRPPPSPARLRPASPRPPRSPHAARRPGARRTVPGASSRSAPAADRRRRTAPTPRRGASARPTSTRHPWDPSRRASAAPAGRPPTTLTFQLRSMRSPPADGHPPARAAHLSPRPGATGPVP